MAKERYQGQNAIKKVISVFFKSPDDFKKACDILGASATKLIYTEVLKNVQDDIEKCEKNVVKDYHRFKGDYSKIKQLSKLLTLLETEVDQELFEGFYEFNHLINIELPIMDNERITNYLFNTGNSSELFDLNENKGKALFHAICSGDIKLLHRLFAILTINLSENTNNITELYETLSNIYNRLKSTLSKEIKRFVKDKLDCYGTLLCGNTFKLLSEAEEIEKSCSSSSDATNKRKQAVLNLIRLFAKQPQELDKLTLTIIVHNIEILGLPISHELRDDFRGMIGILDAKNQFYWLKQMMEVTEIDDELKEYEDEVKKMEAEYMKPGDLKEMRKYIVFQLREFAEKFVSLAI